MKAVLTIAILLYTALCGSAAGKKPRQLVPYVFRLIGTDKETLPAIRRDGRIVTPRSTLTYGIFLFRHRQAKPIEFWGTDQPKHRKFTTMYTQYRVNEKGVWTDYPMGYCATGATTYRLLPGVEYKLRIEIGLLELPAGQQLRVSAESPDGVFWSEPFNYPKQ